MLPIPALLILTGTLALSSGQQNGTGSDCDSPEDTMNRCGVSSEIKTEKDSPERSSFNNETFPSENLQQKDLCTGQINGFYPNYTDHCSSYYRCESRKTTESHLCPPPSKFDALSQMCLPDHMVTCALPTCNTQKDDHYWIPGSLCRSYYTCQRGTPSIHTCPPNSQFSHITLSCEMGGECFEPVCTGKMDGEYADTTHACRRSFTCKGGRPVAVTACPPATIHDGRNCVPTEEATCLSPLNSAITVETVRDDCTGYSNGFHVLPATGCRRYQLCEDGKALARFTCPPGTKFDGNSCYTSDDCSDLCHGKKDGYHPDTTQGCRKYHYCRQEATVQRYSCPQGSLYTGTMCLPAPLVTCKAFPSRAPSSPCLGLSDGYHGDYLHGCVNYFFCSNYHPLVTSTCPRPTVWDGFQCVKQHQNHCQASTERPVCHGRTTGLYPELATDCKTYWYCHNGNATLLTCPQFYVFDGERCVPQETYLCPSQQPESCYNKSDGYYADEESGCRAYYSCSNHQKTTFLCPEGLFFNGTSCAGDFTCREVYSECNVLEDGYYADRASRCRNYFFCRGRRKFTRLACDAGKVFDGVRCKRVKPADMARVCPLSTI